MWREEHAVALERATAFDLVIEPEDLADSFDRGPTVAERPSVLRVPPIRLTDTADMLPRAAARRALDLPEDAVVAVLQLGSGRNTDLARIRAVALAALLEDPRVVVIELAHPVGHGAGSGEGARHRVLELYPAARSCAAFDLAVSAAGYNAFHELLLGAVPTIFVPNEAEEMDHQVLRARYAELHGLALMARRGQDLHRMRELVVTLLDDAVRERMRGRLERLDRTNGAAAAARFLAEMGRMVRADYDVRG
jgi:UDP:flavonoid glycosyltransferase YjiC (YdhE family)